MAAQHELQIIIRTRKEGQGLSQAEDETKKLGKAADFVKGQLLALGTAAVAMAAGRAIFNFAKESIMAFAELEAAMSNVGAVSNASAEQLTQLTDTAKEMGRTTKFTAQEAASGMQFLAMAGFGVNETIGALPGTLQLAAAANLDLGRSADIVSNVLTGYGKDVEDLAHVNDVLVKAFTSSNVDLTQLGEAMKYAGPVAKGMGIAFEETAAAIGLMGNAGMQGSLAGTALRGALVRLANPTAQINKVLERLGINIKDSSGNMLPLVDIISQLESSGASTSDMMAIFGQRAGPAMAALVDQGSEALRGFTTELENAGGTAERVSEQQLDNLKGDLTLLASAWDGLKIQIGESGAWRGLIQGLTAATTATTNAMASQDMLTDAYRAGEITYLQWIKLSHQARAGNLTAAEATRLMEGGVTDLAEATKQTNAEMAAWEGRAAQAEQGTAGWAEATAELTEEMKSLIIEEVKAMDPGFLSYLGTSREMAEALAVQLGGTAEAIDYLRANTADAAQGGGAYEVSAEQVTEAEKERAKAHEEAAKAAEKAAEEAEAAAKKLAAASGDYFIAAMNAEQGTGFFNESLDQLGQQFVTVGGRTAEQNARLGELRGEYDDLMGTYEKAQGTIRDYELGLKGLNLTDEQRAEKIAEQRQLMANAEAAMGSYTDAMQPLVDITGDLAERNVEASVNQEAVNSALFDAVKASGASAEQLAILGGALGLYSEEAVEAALQSAAIQIKINELAQAYVDGQISVDDMRNSLNDFIGGLGDTNTATDDTTRHVHDMKNEMLEMEGLEVTARIDVDTADAEARIAHIKTLLEGIGAGGVGIDETVGGAGRQHGGDVWGGNMFRVGEGNQPEGLFMQIPGDRGRVFSNHQMMGMMGGRQLIIEKIEVHVDGGGRGGKALGHAVAQETATAVAERIGSLH